MLPSTFAIFSFRPAVTTRLFLRFVLLALAAGCKKEALDADGLVPATREGKNTGDFLRNSQPDGPGRSSANPSQAVGAYWQRIRGGRKVVVILVRWFPNDDTGLNIVLSRLTRPGLVVVTDGVSPAIVAGDRSCFSYRIT